ncbi:hypothetical protein WR25_19386 [Diploscapter pachys]|uniref:Apple domain-containing protein n=1 Tax=Diploscapter pachys TaxID=2018661 RepID=A0A2A2K984_9BILA|nr:hypothetical protein WR25_19386 [Diploscapter pachys]
MHNMVGIRIWIERFALLLILPTSILGIAIDGPAKCFQIQPHKAISNGSSLAELYRVSAGDCLNYCIAKAARVGETCASVVYHKEFATCQLYSHIQGKNGWVMVPAEGHDLYVRSSWNGVCKDKFEPRDGFATNAKIFGSTGLQRVIPIPLLPSMDSLSRTTTEPPNKPKNYRNFGHIDEKTFMLPNSPSQFGPQFNSNRINHDTEDMDSFAKPQAYNPSMDKSFMKLRNNSKGQEYPEATIAFVNPTHSSKCEKKEKISYFVIFAHRLVSNLEPHFIRGIDQSSCIMYCSQNINALGEQTPCHSANYNPTDEICTIYGEQNRQLQQAAKLTKDEKMIFVDKFCMTTRKDCSQETPYMVHLHKQIHRSIIKSIPGVNSIVACLATCVDNPECRAVTYKLGLCVLHSASPSIDKSLLVEGSEHTLVVENGCQLTAASVPSLLSDSLTNDTPWDEWSPCQFGTKQRRLRVRHKQNPNTNDQDVQIEECD